MEIGKCGIITFSKAFFTWLKNMGSINGRSCAKSYKSSCKAIRPDVKGGPSDLGMEILQKYETIFLILSKPFGSHS